MWSFQSGLGRNVGLAPPGTSMGGAEMGSSAIGATCSDGEGSSVAGGGRVIRPAGPSMGVSAEQPATAIMSRASTGAAVIVVDCRRRTRSVFIVNCTATLIWPVFVMLVVWRLGCRCHDLGCVD